MQPDKTIKDYTQYRPEEFTFSYGWVQNWFSNFCLSPFEIDGITYASVENFYQSHKVTDEKVWESMSKISPRDSKKRGRTLNIREDWEEVKYDIMLQGLRAKFSKDPWKSLLIEDTSAMIIEWNNWGDKIWGVSIKDNKGQNLLGQALMQVRDELTTKGL